MLSNKLHSLVPAVLLLGMVLAPSLVLAEVSEQLVSQRKDAFNELWHSAAETMTKRSALEQNLANFDERVGQAKQDLERAAGSRRAVREKIALQRTLIDTLAAQAKALDQSRSFYTGLAKSESGGFVSFVRLLAVRDLVASDIGSLEGGAMLRRIVLGESLGDSIDASLARSAIIRSRAVFVRKVGVLATEADHAAARLAVVQKDLTESLVALEKQSSAISSVVDAKTSFIDMSWKEKTLTEAELLEVQKESAEASERMAAAQKDLLKINDELKASKLKALRAELTELQAKQQDLDGQKTKLTLQDAALLELQNAALKALNTAMQQRNTDPKLYKRIAEAKLAIAQLDLRWHELVEHIAGSGSDLASVPAEALSVHGQIAQLRAQIDLMKQGVSADLAEALVIAKARAEDAESKRSLIASELAALAPQMAVLQKQGSDKIGEISTTERDSGLDGLPPLFVWPVIGPITADYHSADYKRVFGIDHQADDIAVAQGTPIKPIAEGVVLASNDGGATGYSYILIGHQSGYASLYGHVSKSFVRTGDVVSFGQIIGLSGGAPGSHGAGPMTTGSHVHLEITKDGVHIDPRSVLPQR